MSTYHTLLLRDATGGSPSCEIGIDERSNTFDLHVYSRTLREMCKPEFLEDLDPGVAVEVVEKLSFEDLRKIRDRINRVLGYYKED